ncbi:MAG: COG4223 family protein, partial [Paracoccaceae bacterium]
DSFAEAARSALNAARDELNESEGFTGIGNYLRQQFQARSVTPKMGDDADAVLSRVEQELRENDLTGALNELDALPDAARDQMQPWIDQARERQDALEQLDILSQEIGN